MKIERMLQSHKSQHIHHEVTAIDRWHYQAETDMVALGSEIKNEKTKSDLLPIRGPPEAF